MKKLLLVPITLFFTLSSIAQVITYQKVDKEIAEKVREAPQGVVGELYQLRGFGCFLKVEESSKYYDNLVGFYEIGKEEENFLVFFITAQLLDKKGKVIVKSNTIKAKMKPNEVFYPHELTFEDGTYERLDGGSYELRLTAIPMNKRMKEMWKSGKPELRLFFKK